MKNPFNRVTGAPSSKPAAPDSAERPMRDPSIQTESVDRRSAPPSAEMPMPPPVAETPPAAPSADAPAASPTSETPTAEE